MPEATSDMITTHRAEPIAPNMFRRVESMAEPCTLSSLLSLLRPKVVAGIIIHAEPQFVRA